MFAALTTISMTKFCRVNVSKTSLTKETSTKMYERFISFTKKVNVWFDNLRLRFCSRDVKDRDSN